MKNKLPSGDLEGMKLGSCHVNDVIDGVLVNKMAKKIDFVWDYILRKRGFKEKKINGSGLVKGSPRVWRKQTLNENGIANIGTKGLSQGRWKGR